jgi:RND family efflux transporter MFP subunit
LLGALLATGCGHKAPPKEAKAQEVIVTTPVRGEVADYQDFTGRLDAFKTVEVRPRVSGYVIEAPFKEGDEVKKDDVLFRIDPRPYQASFDAAKAQLAAAQAQVAVGENNLKLAKVTLDRAIAAGSAATALELDQDRTQHAVTQANLNLARANVGTAQANLDTARLNLEWTTVKAPLPGRISRRNVDPGNLVTADTTMLTTIVTTTPLYAYFDVDERTYLELVGRTPSGPGSWFTGSESLAQGQYPVLIRLANEEEFTRLGRINFLDNRVNANTGTIRMRGTFDNTEGFLKAGLFVRIRLPIGAPYSALLVPDEALQSDQGRKFVWVVNDENKVEYRGVTLGQAVQGLRVIKEGLAEGDRVIVSGTQRARKGLQVRVTPREPPSAPEVPLAKLLAAHRAAPAKAGTN